MARTTEEVDLIVRAITEGFQNVINEMDDVGDSVEDSGDSADFAGQRYTELASKLGLVKEAFGGVQKVAKLTIDTIKRGAEVEQTTQTFNNLAASIGETGDALRNDLKQATSGMVSNFELMQSANRFLAMGLADTSDEVSELSEVAVKLGGAMGVGPAKAMEDFALLLANQSIPRLDTFGISSGKVRERIAELTTGVNALDKETAFMIATMEQANLTLGKVEVQTDNTAASVAKLEASAANLKDRFAVAFSTRWAPIIGGISDVVDTLDQKQQKLNEAVEAGIISQEDADIMYNRLFLTFNDWGGEVSMVIDELDNLNRQQEKVNEEAASADRILSNYIATTNDYISTTATATAMVDKYGYVLRAKNAAEEDAAYNAERVAARTAEVGKVFSGLVGTIDSTAGPISDYLQAQQDMEDASGEWVESFRDNTREIEDINAQIFGDLSAEQLSAFNDIVSDAEEGGAEWVAAYDAVQGDLSESQRNALISRKAELEASNGELASVYTGDAAAFEEAQERKIEADAELSRQLRQSALDVAEARILTQGGDAIGNLEGLLTLQTAMGTITEDEAAARLTQAENTLQVQEVTQGLMDVYLGDGVLAREEAEKLEEVIGRIEAGATLTTEGFVAMGSEGITAASDLNTEIQLTEDGLIRAVTEAGNLKNEIIDGIPDKKVVEIEIRVVGDSIPDLGGVTDVTSDVMQQAGVN